MKAFNVEDKVVLITGAGSGFGRATAIKMAENGARVIATDINHQGLEDTKVLARNMGSSLVTLHHDVGSEKDWKRVAYEVNRCHDRLDGLINNAGYMLTKPYLKTSLDEFRAIQRVNVDSVWMSVQCLYPLLKAAGSHSVGASVINLSSIYGQISGFSQSAYSATKGAVRMLTKSQAVEFARAGDAIRVNSVHPGPGNTALAENGVKQMIENGLVASADEALAFLTQLIPAGRFAEAEDIADLMLFLCSDASRYFTGAEFTLDGGYTAI